MSEHTTLAETTRTVWVVSTHHTGADQLYGVDSADEDLAGSGSGAFDWYRSYEDALDAYLSEMKLFMGLRARVRLLAMQVPADLEGEDLTDYLNADIDALEIEASALAQGDLYRS